MKLSDLIEEHMRNKGRTEDHIIAVRKAVFSLYCPNKEMRDAANPDIPPDKVEHYRVVVAEMFERLAKDPQFLAAAQEEHDRVLGRN